MVDNAASSSIVVAIDGSVFSDRAVDAAVEVARAFNAELLLCHAIDTAKAGRMTLGDPALLEGSYKALEEDGDAFLRDASERVTRAGGRARTKLVYGDPADEISNVARHERARMIVVGTHGRAGISQLLLGSVAAGIVRNAAVPVMVVPPTGEARR